MSLEARIMEALKTAMKTKDEAGLRTLRAIKSAILIQKTAEGGNGEVTEAHEMAMLQRLAKQRRESLQIFTEQGREDLAAVEQEELKILEEFLPQQMTEEELRAEVKILIAETSSSSPADMGKVMGAANKKLAGKADGKTLSGIVKEMLGSK